LRKPPVFVTLFLGRVPLVIPAGVRAVAVAPPHVMRVRRVPKDEPTKKVSHANQEREKEILNG